MDGGLRVWHERGGIWQSVELTRHTHSVLALATLADGNIVSGNDDKNLRIWSRDSGDNWNCEVLNGYGGFAIALAALADGSFVYSGRDDELRIWRKSSNGEWQIENLGSQTADITSRHYTRRWPDHRRKR